ncbi:hypothetical protein DL98DRAFT_440462, partial [Cadophora sp. DSE1049]
LFQPRLPNSKILLPLFKIYLGIFLQALDCFYSEYHIIYTTHFIINLKMDNILIGFEHLFILEEYIEKQAKNFMLRKIKDSRSIYLLYNNFKLIKSFRVLPKIADFGLI